MNQNDLKIIQFINYLNTNISNYSFYKNGNQIRLYLIEIL